MLCCIWLLSLGGGLVTTSCLTLETSWTVACQAPLSMGFSRQEYRSGLPFPSPGDLPDPGIKPGSPALQAILYWLSCVNLWCKHVSVVCYHLLLSSILLCGPTTSFFPLSSWWTLRLVCIGLLLFFSFLLKVCFYYYYSLNCLLASLLFASWSVLLSISFIRLCKESVLDFVNPYYVFSLLFH